jgi:RHS repeat-associated protein
LFFHVGFLVLDRAEFGAEFDEAGVVAGRFGQGGGQLGFAVAGPGENFTWDTTPTVPQLLMDSANAYIHTGPGAPTEQVSLATGTPTYLATDALGSVRGTINPTGALTATTSYDAYGNPQSPGGLTATTPFGYAGGYTDPTGLIYLIHRYYDPTTGQFTSTDPSLATTLQPYAYASGDPIDNTDPTGLCAQNFCPPPPAHGTNPTPAHAQNQPTAPPPKPKPASTAPALLPQHMAVIRPAQAGSRGAGPLQTLRTT